MECSESVDTERLDEPACRRLRTGGPTDEESEMLQKGTLRAALHFHEAAVRKSQGFLRTAQVLGETRMILSRSVPSFTGGDFVDHVYDNLPPSSLLRRHMNTFTRQDAQLLLQLHDQIQVGSSTEPTDLVELYDAIAGEARPLLALTLQGLLRAAGKANQTRGAVPFAQSFFTSCETELFTTRSSTVSASAGICEEPVAQSRNRSPHQTTKSGSDARLITEMHLRQGRESQSTAESRLYPTIQP